LVVHNTIKGEVEDVRTAIKGKKKSMTRKTIPLHASEEGHSLNTPSFLDRGGGLRRRKENYTIGDQGKAEKGRKENLRLTRGKKE